MGLLLLGFQLGGLEQRLPPCFGCLGVEMGKSSLGPVVVVVFEILAAPLAHLEGLMRVWGTMETTEAWVGSGPWEPLLIGLSGRTRGW